MIARQELKKVFKLFRKHEDLLSEAYLDQQGEIDETSADPNAVDALLKAKLLQRPTADDPARLSRELMELFERVLVDPRRLSINEDVGTYLIELDSSVEKYKTALRRTNQEDANYALNQVERLVDRLQSNLKDRSGHLWEKINTDFGYASSLEFKIKENELALERARELNNSLQLIKIPEIIKMIGGDSRLRPYLQGWLLTAVDTCLQETQDAIHRLNDLLFEFRQQQGLSKLIHSFYHKYQSDPGYQPNDYIQIGSVPEVFNRVASLPLHGHANLEDTDQEFILSEILFGLRKEKEIDNALEPSERVEVDSDTETIELDIPALRTAVESFYEKVIDTSETLSVVDHYPNPDIEPDIELWLYAVITRFNNMDATERKYFAISYDEDVDPVFNGRHLVKDIHISLRPNV